MKSFTNLLITGLLVIMCLSMASTIVETCKPKFDSDPFETTYKAVIVNDHQVNLVSKNDTVTLYLENSGTFAEDEIVYVKHN